MKNFYSILGVPENADFAQIKAAHRKLAKKFHPDRNPNDPTAEENFKSVQHAFDVLSDTAKREQHDQDLRNYRAEMQRKQKSIHEESVRRFRFRIDPAVAALFVIVVILVCVFLLTNGKAMTKLSS